jgi:aminomethyltransferase
MKRSPVHARHVAAGAKFSEFGGWAMPLEYAGGGVLAEHTAVRTAVGLFDVSHLGKISVTGPGAAGFVNRCLTADLRKITPGQAQYTLICNDDGGVVDDLIAYLHSVDHVFLIPNAANCAEVARLLAGTAPDEVSVADEHEAHAVFAVQGPHSDEVLESAGLPAGHGYMSFVATELDGVPVTVCRTGYTGERGYELVAPSDRSEVVWDRIVAAGEPYGLQLAGLGARDTLRTEMGYPLHGQDISPDISPVQARLGWAVGWKKDVFFGDAALRAEKEATPNRLLWGLQAVGRGIPRPGMLVRDGDGHEIGSITSGTFSPTLKTGIALALLDARFVVDERVQVDVRNRREAFRIVKPPFVTPGVREP